MNEFEVEDLIRYLNSSIAIGKEIVLTHSEAETVVEALEIYKESINIG